METDTGIYLVRVKGYFEGYSMGAYMVRGGQLYEVVTPAVARYDEELGLLIEKPAALMFKRVEKGEPETVEQAPALIEKELVEMEKGT